MRNHSLPLSNGKATLVDPDIAEKYGHIRWSEGGRGYAVRQVRLPGGKRQNELLHRVVMGAQPGQQIDHINSDKLDNRRANLRFSTQSQNCANRSKRSGTISKFKGVNRIVGDNGNVYWRTECNNRHVGHSPTEEEAARMYDRRAWELWGEFAKLNFPDEDPSKHPPIVCTLHRWHGGPTCIRCGEPAPPHYRYRRAK